MRSIAVLAVVYLLSAKLGLQLAVVNSYATAVWPPAGIALAALLLRGYKIWPGIWIGAFLVNLTTGDHLTWNGAFASFGIAAGNTLEALLGAWLVNRYAGGVRAFEHALGVFRFTGLAALGSTLISATMAVGVLLLCGLAKPAAASDIWITWWVGDAVGDLIVAPAVILWASNWRMRWNRAAFLEAGLVLLALVTLSLIAFTTLLPPDPTNVGLAFLCAPALLWAAFRFGPRGTAAAMLIVSGIAIWGWVEGMMHEQTAEMYVILELQAYLGVTAVTSLAVAAEVSDRRRHQLDMQRQAAELARLAAIVESSDDAIVGMTLGGVITSWNSGAERIFAYLASEVVGRPISVLAASAPDDEMPAIMARIRAGGNVAHFETKRRRKDGAVIDVSVAVSPVRAHTGEVAGASTVARDITDRKRLEEQIRQAQKLESIGVLAGGVAHDFNNLLVGILGNASLAVEILPPGHRAHELLKDVVAASQMSAALVRQLLAYAGKGRFLIEPVRLPEMVREISRLVRPSIPKTVELRFDLAADVPPAPGDTSQLHQLLMNLIINAAEAIGDQPGTIRIGVRKRQIEGGELPPGCYVALEVQDTGCGMDEETRLRIFDPFFTTKFTGRGLGLAAVHGIVRGHKGEIRVRTAPGLGTTFEVLIPAEKTAAAYVGSAHLD
jgi:two-component system cell cycle sensor histidine kinase/response regulator CckA